MDASVYLVLSSFLTSGRCYFSSFRSFSQNPAPTNLSFLLLSAQMCASRRPGTGYLTNSETGGISAPDPSFP